MKNISLFILLITFVFAFAGCSDDDTDIVSLSIMSSDVQFSASGGNGAIVVSASGAISASSNKSWVIISESEVTTSSIPFVVSENAEISSRTATITIMVAGQSEEVHIVQEGWVFSMAGDITMPAAASTVHLGYETNTGTEPVVTSVGDESWLSALVLDGELVITTLSNNVLERSAAITVASGWKSHNITVTQKGILDKTSVKVFNGDIQMYNTITLDENAKAADYTISTNDPWVQYSATGNVLTIYTVADNETGSIRKGTVTVTYAGVTASIDVIQYPYTYYQFFLGSWTMNSMSGAKAVTLEERVAGSSYLMRGLYFAFEVKLDSSTGYLTIESHEVAHGDTFVVYLCPYDSETGNLTNYPGVGFNLIFNGDTDNPVLAVEDNGVWGTTTANTIMFGIFSPFNGMYLDYYDVYWNISSFAK